MQDPQVLLARADEAIARLNRERSFRKRRVRNAIDRRWWAMDADRIAIRKYLSISDERTTTYWERLNAFLHMWRLERLLKRT